MGRDKALLPFLGQPLISRILARISSLADELLVTTNHPEDYQFLGLPLYRDVISDRGALGGLYTALYVAHSDLVAVVACDMPFVNPDLLTVARDRLMNTRADVVIPQTEQGFEPFHAVYRRDSCLPAVKAALDAGQWRLISWFSEVQVSPFTPEELLRYDPQQRAFWNLNTPEDLREAERLALEIDNAE